MAFEMNSVAYSLQKQKVELVGKMMSSITDELRGMGCSSVLVGRRGWLQWATGICWAEAQQAAAWRWE